MGRAGYNTHGRKVWTVKDSCLYNEELVAQKTRAQLREEREKQPGPRKIAIEEYIKYKKADDSQATHEEKLEHVLNFFKKLKNKEGYSESYIRNALENAPKWIEEFVNGVTNKYGQSIRNSRDKKGDDDAR